MRALILLWLAAGCGRLAFDRHGARDPDAGITDSAITDSSPGPDSAAPTPAFVQNVERNCLIAQSCVVMTPGTSVGNILLATVTYNPPSVAVASVADDLGRPFTRVIDPIDWSPGRGNFHSEVWWIRNQGANSVTVTLTGTSSTLLNIYVDEFVATAIDQTAAASGVAAAATTVSSGSRNVSVVPQIVFGHGEGQGPMVYPAVGFTLHSNANANVEETKLVTAAGSYDAQFTLDRSGDWVALMVTLR